MTRIARRLFALAIVSLCIAIGGGTSAQSPNAPARAGKSRAASNDPGDDARLSAMGRLARRAARGQLKRRVVPIPPDAGGDEAEDNPAGGQAETSIAVSADGMHVVVGHNDTRGFDLNPFSVSGFMYSDDGGATFVDGGQLPTGTPTGAINGESFPQVFGDPEVKYLGGSTFVYFSIMVRQISATGTAQTMCVHRSTDNGHTWQGPFEIPAATNPHGQLSGADALDAADKEFADVDPDTGRVLMSWSNFTSTAFAAGGVEISTTFSDNLATATPPTWSARAIVANGGFDGQGSMPRFAGNGSSSVYVVWEQTASLGGVPVNRIGFSTSTNNGASWGTAMTVEGVPATDATGSTFFKTMDYVLGNDRSHDMPAIAVDTSPGAAHGTVYVVYADNANSDGSDVMFRRSTNSGATFSAKVRINSRPGADRAQWFPSVTVDRTTGRVYVYYYDQGIATDGDLTEYSFQFSDDGGATWSRPAPLTSRPFHAAYGNDTGQPNLGDYNQGFARNGELFAVWAATPPLVAFTDGVPSVQMTVPDVTFARQPATTTRVSLSLGTIAFADAGAGTLGGNGSIDPGETVTFTIPVRNYVSNGINQTTITGIGATLSTTTPGVAVTQAASSYPNVGANATVANTTPFTITTAASFVAGTRIELSVAVTSAQGSTTLPFSQSTGTALATTLLSESFDVVGANNLPAGWTAAHGAGANTVNWTTSTTSLGASNQRATISRAAFHINANDGGVNANARWERLFSPTFNVPAASEYVTVDFDVAYDTENDPNFAGLTYDGMLLRIFDATNNRTIAAEAFAETFAAGASTFYPKHLNRDDDPGYFQDLSAFGGDSRSQPGANANGFQHVRLKLPGMAGVSAQLRFEFTQDFTAACNSVRTGHTCGVLVDNVVVQSARSIAPSTTLLASSANPSASGQSVTITATVTTGGGAFATDGTVTFKEGSTVLAGPTAVVNGQASFTTSALGLGTHTIVAQYTPGSPLGTASSASVSQHVVVTASIANVSVPEGAGGTTAANFTVSLSQPSPETVSMNYATADGTATVAGFDYATASGLLTFTPGQTSRTITVNVIGDTKPEFNETFVVNLSNVTNALASTLQATGTIVNDDAGTVVDAAAVVQSITNGANRLKQIQHPDGGWPYIVGTFVCGGTFGTCPNTIGTTALGLLATYQRTGDTASRAGAQAAGNLLVSRYNDAVAQNPAGLPFSQDVEFLMWLAQVTGNPMYSSTAVGWFQIEVNRFPNAGDRVADLLTKRNAQHLRSNAAWDVASVIRAAKAVGNAQYALDAANAIVAAEGQWKDTNPAHRFDRCGNPSQGCGAADNPFAFDLTLLGEGSLLWAIHDLPGFASKVAEYSAFLFAQQDPGGSWDAGDTEITAYVVMGLAAIGGQQSDNAMTLAGGFFIDRQFANGGWPASVGAFANPDEIGEIDGEAVRAMNALFNTPAGNGMSITPAQLARITFADVTTPGQTTVVALDPSSVPAPGPGYEIVRNIAYRVSTTATTTGDVVVCFSVPWVTDPGEIAALRLLHLEGDALVDRTILPAGSPLCARAAALGPFVVARLQPDRTPPDATVTLTPAVLWPPNGRMVTITATIAAVDDVDPSPAVALLSVTSSEPDDDAIAGAAIGTDDRSFALRADRRGDGIGRIYTVVYRVTDAAGNSRDIAAHVVVPHDQSPAPASEKPGMGRSPI